MFRKLIVILMAVSVYSSRAQEWKTMETAAGTLNYQDTGGDGEVLILVHGLGSNALAFKKNVQDLSGSFRLIIPDLPGYGRSSGMEMEPSMTGYAGIIKELAEQLDIKKAVVAGHSMGGQVALSLALQQPDWLKGVFLLAPAGIETFTEAEVQWFHTYATAALMSGLTDAQIKTNFDVNFFGNTLPEDAGFMYEDRLAIKSDAVAYPKYLRTVEGGVRAMLSEPVFAKLDELQIPVVAVYGLQDNLIPNRILHPGVTVQEIGARLDSLKNFQPTIYLEEAGHFVQWDRAQTVNELITNFAVKALLP